jgi:RNA polymerase sigma factor (sigma-70 family)
MTRLTLEEPPSVREPIEEVELRRVQEEAAEWTDRLQDADREGRCLFADWLARSPHHIDEFLRMCALNHELQTLGRQKALSGAESASGAADQGATRVSILTSCGLGQRQSPAEILRHALSPMRLPLAASHAMLSSLIDVGDNTPDELQKQLYLRYRLPLLEVFHSRRIPPDAADDLLQHTFLKAITRIRTENSSALDDLGGFLYRTACKLATSYWRGDLSRSHEGDREILASVEDEALTQDERLDHEQMARHVRDLMDHLPVQRDREVLERFYLHEEPRTAIRESLRLTDVQFSQVLWRARQRFGEILRKHGFTFGKEPTHSSSAVRPAGSQTQPARNVFLSYAHRDRAVLDRLHQYLGHLKQEGSITTWIDRDICAGTALGRDADSQLENSKLFVPLVSADFLNSGYCYDREMTKAFRMHETGRITIVPIIVADCDWLSSPLRQFKPLPGDGKPIEAWDNARVVFLEVISGLRRRLAQSE